MKMTKDNRLIIGTTLLFLSFALIATGGGLTWGITGALWAAGITLSVFAVGFFASCSNS